MTKIQQALWELRMDYIGHPYYVSGNAILHALDQNLDPETHAEISASHGVFVPGQFGTFPDEHSQSGIRRISGAACPMWRPTTTCSSSGRRCTRGCWIPAPATH